MSMGSRALFERVIFLSTLLALIAVARPGPVSAAVGGSLLPMPIMPTTWTTVDGELVNPTCGTQNNQGGTSVAIVQGRKLAKVNAIKYPVLLAITCLDGSDVTKRARVNFISLSPDLSTNTPAGAVIKSIQTKISGTLAAPGNGWAHLVHRPDKGDLLACGTDGTIYSIDYSQLPTTADDGTATLLPRPSGLSNSCAGLAWDPEEDMIYLGQSAGSGKIDVVRFKDVTAVLGTVNTPTTCTPSGLAITGGVLVVACYDAAHTILRYNKNIPPPSQNPPLTPTLSPNGTLAATVTNPLGDLACDPVTFSGQFRDALWSRNGLNGNGVVALEFPPFTCGLPSNATVFWAGLSAPSGSVPGAVLNPACFDAAGNVKDSDGDGLPDCWETPWSDGKPGIDFDGDGVRDVVLCVDKNGDGVFDVPNECARPDRKDLFVETDWMQDHKPDPEALSQTQSVATVGVKSVREAFLAAPVPVCIPGNLLCTSTYPTGIPTGIRLHIQVDEQASFTTFAGTAATHVTELVFTPCTPPHITINSNGSTTQNVKSLSDSADFDVIKKANFGTAAERQSGANTLNAKRLAFRYILFGHNLTGTNGGGSGGSGCSEVAGDDATVTMGSFAQTIVGGVTHNRGLTDQQAGTFMHEFGHTLGLEHGGHDKVNCKPNYLSVMSYSRQFAGSPVPNRRLDYSSAQLLTLNEAGGLNEGVGLGVDASLNPEPPFFPLADQTAFGPSAWSIVTATGVTCPLGSTCINWDRSKQGPNPTYQSATSADLNNGPGGCDGSNGFPATAGLEGHNDWNSLLYRASAALDFAGGVHATSNEAVSITSDQEQQMFLGADLDGNGFADAQDCGAFTCTHRIDIKPSFPVPKVISLGAEANVTIAIFSEPNGAQPPPPWSAPDVVQTATLKFEVESLVFPVKINNSGGGTCSTSDVDYPATGKDGIKDLKCQFPTSGMPLGTHHGVVSGFFTFVDPVTNQTESRGFRARQDFTVVP
jgi:hypothetical protein